MIQRALWTWVCVGMAACHVVMTPLADAQVPNPFPSSSFNQDEWWYGFHLLEMLFKQSGLIELNDPGRAFRSNPHETVVVIVGEFDSLSFYEVNKFLRDGGAVLFATDHSVPMAGLGYIRRGPVVSVDDQSAYQGFRDCPRITELDRDHPVMQGVNELIANRTGNLTRLSSTRVDWRILASLPDSMSPLAEQVPIIAAAEFKESDGRFLVLADHSLLTNGMLWHGDNAIFAINACQWISAGRKRFLFLTDGTVGSGPLPPPELPERLPPLPDKLSDLTREELITFTNKLITGLEDANVFNQLATNRLPFISDRMFRRSLLLLAAGIMAALLLLRWTRSRSPVVKPLQDRPMPSATDLRIEQRVTIGAYELAARQLAMDFLQSLTGSAETRFRSQDVVIRSRFPLRSSIRADLSWVLQVANSDRQKISLGEFRSLQKSVRRLHRLHHQHRLSHSSFLVPVEPEHLRPATQV